jgi:2-polyprenyl-3-methyl-5-hydroxy-6-metoxy-1,4-benzoquinol methylase
VLATRGRGLEPLTTVVCGGCGLVSHHPLPDPAEVAAFYATRYRVAYKGGWEPKRKHALRALRGAVARAGRLAPLLPPGARVLDIGASSGEFTYVMQRAGFAARGIEPNLGYADFARRTYGVAVESGGMEEAGIAPGSLDLVTLNHVLEHLADPWDALRRIGGWLAPGGLLFIEVPNLAGVRKQASNTFHTAHIWNFTPETLALLAWQQGFAALTPGELTGTSMVLRRRRAEDSPPVGADAGLAERLARQVATTGRPLPYLLSGAPVTRRIARLRRNVEERIVCARHATVREMADAILAGAGTSAAPSARLPGFGATA